ncbi:MAG: hypothetical protein MJ172_01660 [Clostridia bacterium]|nr:hypothetical protein [Clostridia bacterium]
MIFLQLYPVPALFDEFILKSCTDQFVPFERLLKTSVIFEMDVMTTPFFIGYTQIG